MFDLLWLIPFLPLAGFLTITFGGSRLPSVAAAVIGVGSVSLSAVLSFLLGGNFLLHPPEGDAHVQFLWTWMQVGDFAPSVAFRLDALSIVMLWVITGVGALIHLYSVEYMRGDKAFKRFFAYMNLFVCMMLILVLADNLLLLYLGWEGVGLCSYLLIGFWSEDPSNGAAARKAFIVTRVGDTAMALGLFILATELGTLDIQTAMARALERWPVGSNLAVATALLLLIGALGKSAQLPLHTWLPDAMAGPTPVSALIHAATMVTAGVYLIARTHLLYSLAPTIQFLIAVIGGVTLLVAGCSALSQKDIKRVLAYSTISQIGYMFVALGIGAWQAAMFHFMTHAFFKALLFLGAGSVILSLHHEQNMLNMGGLWRRLPITFWTFLAGVCSLADLPLVTAGYYSKDLILHEAWLFRGMGWFPWVAGVIGAFLTSLYCFRMLFRVFFGEEKTPVSYRPGWRIHLPLTVLAVLALAGGFCETPEWLGRVNLFSRCIEPILPGGGHEESHAGGMIFFQITALGVPLLGLLLAIILYLKPRTVSTNRFMRQRTIQRVRRFWLAGWGFDALYDFLFVKPFIWAAQINRNDCVDRFYTGIAWLNGVGHRVLSFTQSGRVRWYVAGIVAGAVLILGMVVAS
jgi:NADH-quinone oxidoreductase subunit L